MDAARKILRSLRDGMNYKWDLVRDEDTAHEASAYIGARKSLFSFNVPFYGGFASCPGHLGWENVG